jgi:SAM-dependent methyltransferase
MSTHLAGHLVEIGCGAGHYTSRYADLPGVRHVTAIDIDPQVIAEARRAVTRGNVEFRVQDAGALAAGSCDSMVCANVLEHMEDDRSFLRTLAQALAPAGTLALLVPAHPLLYSQCDREAGHYRRYRKGELRSLIHQAGLSIDRLFYFNLAGALGWLYAFKLRQRRQVSEQQSRPMIRLFERYFLPLGRTMERWFPVPFGLSLVGLCRRT